MKDRTGAFTGLMQLTPQGADQFRAPAAPDRSRRMYGGQFIAQALRACQATVADDRDSHSLHATFLRTGVATDPVVYRVERLRDGRSFSQRAVSAYQDERELFRMMASFHVREPGAAYARAQMPQVPAAEDVHTTYTQYTLSQSAVSHWPGASRPMDIRYIDPPSTARGAPILEPQRMWMRVTEALPDAPGMHAAALGYLSDATLVDHLPLPHGRRWQDADLEGASLDHAMWFHRPARADEWLLFDQHVEVTGGARGLASGRFFDTRGVLIATCQQEGLARWPHTEDHT